MKIKTNDNFKRMLCPQCKSNCLTLLILRGKFSKYGYHCEDLEINSEGYIKANTINKIEQIMTSKNACISINCYGNNNNGSNRMLKNFAKCDYSLQPKAELLILKGIKIKYDEFTI